MTEGNTVAQPDPETGEKSERNLSMQAQNANTETIEGLTNDETNTIVSNPITGP